MIYLTTTYPAFYAQHDASESAGMLLLELNEASLSANKFYPDEDFIAEVFFEARRMGECIPDRFARSSLVEIAREIDPIVFAPLLSHCRNHLGNLAYLGSIPPDAITRYQIVELNAETETIYALSGDPLVSSMNYAVRGQLYARLAAAILDKDVAWLSALTDNAYLDSPCVIWGNQLIDGLVRDTILKSSQLPRPSHIFADRFLIDDYSRNIKIWNATASSLFSEPKKCE